MSTRVLRAVARAAVASSFVLMLAGCSDRTAPTAASLAARVSKDQVTPPTVTVTDGDNSVEFWPWTGNDFSGTTGDPINLVFFGQADPRALRAALLLLDGDRSDFGPLAAFTCRWHDVPEGSVQTAFGSETGWTGSVIQLACGDYDIRFHLRLFDLGGGTVGGAHFEVQAPATPNHFVLSWELAQALVTADFVRTGLLGADPGGTAVINTEPTYGEIPSFIFDQLPPELKALNGGQNQIVNDGIASVLTLADSEEGQPLVARDTFTIQFDQTIPKPICTGQTPLDLLVVEGPLTFTQHVVLTPSGNYLSTFQLRGHLDLTLIDGSTGEPVGSPYQAQINEQHHAILTDHVTLAASFNMQIEIPSSGPFRGSIVTRVSVGPGNASFSDVTIRCGR